MIKLAIILDDPGVGGAYRVATDIGNGLRKSDFDIKFYFLCDKAENLSDGIFLGQPTIDIDYSLKSYLRLAFFPKHCEKNDAALNKALDKYQPDIIHFHTHLTLLPLMHGIKNTIPNARLIYTDHSQRIRQGELSPIKQYLMSKVYKRLFHFANVVFVSEYAYETGIKLGYGSKSKDLALVNSIDSERFRPLKVAKKKAIKVVYLSRIHPAKGHDVLLNAWQKLPGENILSLHLYGDEADDGNVKARILEETFMNTVCYEGVTKSPQSVLQDAQIGVFPSFREGLPLALLEMMACGLPVVASDIPEIKSIITDGKDGLLFKCGDENDLADKLRQLIDSEPLRNQLGKEARKTIEKYYSEPIADKYSKLYHVLGKHNG